MREPEIRSLVAVLSASLLASAWVGNPRTAQCQTAEAHGPDSALRVKAKIVTSSPLSPAFASLVGDTEYRLSTEQMELIGRIQEECRAVLAGWLLRGLDKPMLPKEELSARLGKPFEDVRMLVSVQAEALVRGAVLSPAQSRRLRAEVDLGSPSKVIERYGWTDEVIELHRWELRDLRKAILSHARTYRGRKVQASPLYLHFLGPWTQPWERMTQEQAVLADRINKLACEIMAAWFERGINGESPPSEEACLERLLQRSRIRAAVVAHAETILLAAILEPDQAKQFLKYHWALSGVEALRDPELAGILRLSRGQSVEIAKRLEIWRGISESDAIDSQDPPPEQIKRPDEVDPGIYLDEYIRAQSLWERRQQARVEVMRANAHDNVRAVLSRGQAKELARLLDGAIPSPKQQAPN